MRLYEIICSLQVYNVGRGHFCLRLAENTQLQSHVVPWDRGFHQTGLSMT